MVRNYLNYQQKKKKVRHYLDHADFGLKNYLDQGRVHSVVGLTLRETPVYRICSQDHCFVPELLDRFPFFPSV